MTKKLSKALNSSNQEMNLIYFIGNYWSRNNGRYSIVMLWRDSEFE